MKNNQQELSKQEQQATEYAQQLIKSHGEASFGVQGFWQEMVLTYLKEKALNYVATTLKHLAINHLVDLAEWLVEQLEDYLLTLYQQASAEERAIFKEKILAKFPHSKLAQQLKSRE
jgi:hypothetical protein